MRIVDASQNIVTSYDYDPAVACIIHPGAS